MGRQHAAGLLLPKGVKLSEAELLLLDDLERATQRRVLPAAGAADAPTLRIGARRSVRKCVYI